MGNTLRGGGLLSNVAGGGGNDAFHVEVGRHATLDLSETREFDEKRDGAYTKARSMSYKVGDSDCEMTLTRNIDKHGQVKGLILKILCSGPSKLNRNPSQFFEFILKLQSEKRSDVVLASDGVANVSESTELTWKSHDVYCDDGSVIESITWLYGEGHEAGLVRMEQKKRTPAHKKPYAVTVIHYHATSAGIHIDEAHEADFGLSVMAKIEASYGCLSVAVEGPEQHPSSALIYMFKEFERHGGWKRTMCPHCASSRNPKSNGGTVRNTRIKCR